MPISLNRKNRRSADRGDSLVIVLILVMVLIPLLTVLAKLSVTQTRAAYQTRVNLEDRINAEKRIVRMVGLLAEDHRQNHYDPNIVSPADSYMRVNTPWISSGTARLNHMMVLESRSNATALKGLGYLAVVQFVSNFLRCGVVSNGIVTIDANSPLANGTYAGGLWVTGSLTVNAPVLFSDGVVAVNGDVEGNGQLALGAPARLLYGRTASGIVGAGSLYNFIPRDFASVTPIGNLDDYTLYATTLTVVDTTVTFKSNGDIEFDRGSGGISSYSVPAGYPAVVVSSGAALFVQGNVQRAYTVVAAPKGSGNSRVVIIGDVTYQGNSALAASPNATLAVLADQILFQHQTAGFPISASGFFYGRTSITVESPTTVRGVVFSENGNLTTSSAQPLNVIFDQNLSTATPHFLAEKPEIVNFVPQKALW